MIKIIERIQEDAVVAVAATDEMATHEISDKKAEQLINMQLLSEILPHRFPNGNLIERIEIACQKCHEVLEEVRGEATVTNGGMLLALDAFGICRKESCRLITPVEARFRDDGSYLVKAGSTWTERRYAPLVCPRIGGWLKAKLIQLWHKP